MSKPDPLSCYHESDPHSFGFNPIRWDCNNQGCFNLKKRPKIEVFAECFPGRIAMGDVDGRVHMRAKEPASGFFLYLEWKPSPAVSPGQIEADVCRTMDGVSTVIWVAGDAEKMDVTHVAYFAGGEWSQWQPADLQRLKEMMLEWGHKHANGRKCQRTEWIKATWEKLKSALAPREDSDAATS